ncbi:MAG: hypothetical protein ABSH28_23350 [Acidobacteriota bacterium]
MPALLSNYALLILHEMAQENSSVETLRERIICYQENIKREGYTKQDMLDFVSAYQNYSEIADSILREMDKRGGKAALESERDLLDFDEFMSGWDDH